MKIVEKYVCLLTVLLFAVAGCSTGLVGQGSAPLEPNIDGATGVGTGSNIGENIETPVLYPLTVNVVGKGTVNFGSEVFSDSSHPNMTKNYAENATVNLAAAPDAGYEFVSWSGTCLGTGSCTFPMNGEKLVIAAFKPSESPADTGPKTLSIKFAGEGTGNVKNLLYGINCSANCLYTPDTAVTSVALAAKANPDSAFEGWSGASCAGFELCNASLMADNPEVIANFGLAKQLTGQYDEGSEVGQVQVTARTFAGVLPQVTYTPSPYFNGDFPKDAEMTLVARPGSGAYFASWTSGPCAATPEKSTNATCIFTLSDNTSVKFVFKKTISGFEPKPAAGVNLQAQPGGASVSTGGADLTKQINPDELNRLNKVPPRLLPEELKNTEPAFSPTR